MTKYQEEWSNRIKANAIGDTILSVCEEIVLDDTGHTDPLTMALAQVIIEDCEDEGQKIAREDQEEE